MKKRVLIATILSLVILVCPISTSTPITQVSQAATMGETQALRQAKEYVRISAVSKKFLIELLEDDGYSSSEAKYGANHCGANWMKEAVQQAKEYLRISPMSRSELYDILRDDGFTKKQAKHGVNVAYR